MCITFKVCITKSRAGNNLLPALPFWGCINSPLTNHFCTLIIKRLAKSGLFFVNALWWLILKKMPNICCPAYQEKQWFNLLMKRAQR